jgi:prepilin-type N-terminal cleavage/methylation domain-containing protein
MTKSGGFTLAEILAVLAIISIGIGVSSKIYAYMKEEARLEKTIKEAQLILKYADMVRQRSGGLTVGSSPAVYNHARPSLPVGDIPLSYIEGVLNLDTGISSANPWGHPYRVRITDHYSRVTVEVDVNVPAGQAHSVTSLGPTSTELAFIYNGNFQNRLLKTSKDSFKKFFFLEDIR